MFKLFTSLFLSIGALTFADPYYLSYMKHGNMSLLLNRPWQALESFQEAQNSSPSEFSHLLIAIGQIIAYDKLDDRERCERMIGSICLKLCEMEEESSTYSWCKTSSEDSYQSYFWDSSSSDSYTESVVYNPIRECEDSCISYLPLLIKTAPSPDIRNFLFMLLEILSDSSHDTY